MPDMTNLEERIEGKLDKVTLAGTAVSMGFGGVKFQTMIELMEFAKLMSVSRQAVPFHLRDNPGACLAICTKAARFGFDPFALAEHSFSMSKDVDTKVEQPGGGRTTVKVAVETIAYDSYVIRAIIEAWAPIKGRLKYVYSGEGDARKCTVSATLEEDGSVVSLESPTLGERKKAIGTNDRGNVKGSPLWVTKPDQQLGYDTARDLCRRHFPEILMGWYDKDEFEENPRVIEAEVPGIAARMKDRAKDKEGFQPAKIAHQMSEVVPETIKKAEPVEVATDAVVNQDDPVAVMQAAQARATEQLPNQTTPKKAKTEKKAAKPKEAEPEKVEETAMQRGLRLLPAQKTREAIEYLRESIAEELGSDEAEDWHKACDAARAAIK